MAIIDNTLAAQIPTFDPATPLMEAAKIQSAQAELQAAQLKQNQNAVGAEMRGLTPFVNSPEFPQKWAETMDGLLKRGVIDQQAHDQWSKSPSPLMMKSIIAKTDDPQIAFRKEEAQREQKNQDRSYGLQVRTANRLDDPTPDGFEANPDAKTDPTASKYRPLPGGPKDPNYLKSVALAEAEAASANPTKFSTTPIYGVGDDGQPVIMQAGRDGKIVKSQMPEGVHLSGNSPESIKTRATRYLDTGDDSIINPRNFSGPQGQIDYRSLQNEIEKQRQERGMRPDEISSNKIDYKAAQIGANAAARKARFRARARISATRFTARRRPPGCLTGWAGFVRR
jgi:hypothetical protein